MMMDQSRMMSMWQPLQVMNNQNYQLWMNQLVDLSHVMTDQTQPQGRLNNRGGGGGGYGMLPPRKADPLKFKNQNANPSKYVRYSSTTRNNKNWKVKQGNDKRNNNNQVRRQFSKKKFNHGGKSAPLAPRNTTSFLIRAKKSGGVASLVSPSPLTPAVIRTPSFSPSREVLVDTAKEEWGVDGYGSMKGLIRVRSPGNDEDDEHLEVERRFGMIHPNSCVLENRVDDQDTHLTQLEEESLMLKDRLLSMESEFNNLRTRLQCLEMQKHYGRSIVEENNVDNKEC